MSVTTNQLSNYMYILVVPKIKGKHWFYFINFYHLFKSIIFGTLGFNDHIKYSLYKWEVELDMTPIQVIPSQKPMLFVSLVCFLLVLVYLYVLKLSIFTELVHNFTPQSSGFSRCVDEPLVTCCCGMLLGRDIVSFNFNILVKI